MRLKKKEPNVLQKLSIKHKMYIPMEKKKSLKFQTNM
jgi:hypothetical protein